MFVYHDPTGAIATVPPDATVTLADPRPCDGAAARSLVVIDHGGVRRHRPASDCRGALAAALVAHRVG